MIEREHAVAVESLDAIEEIDDASGPYAAAAFENVPWMNSSERSADFGFPGSRTPLAACPASP